MPSITNEMNLTFILRSASGISTLEEAARFCEIHGPDAPLLADGQTQLHLAVQNNRDDLVEMLLKLGASRDVMTIHGDTPLKQAFNLKRQRCMELLLRSFFPEVDPACLPALKRSIHGADKDKSSLQVAFLRNTKRILRTSSVPCI